MPGYKVHYDEITKSIKKLVSDLNYFGIPSVNYKIEFSVAPDSNFVSKNELIFDLIFHWRDINGEWQSELINDANSLDELFLDDRYPDKLVGALISKLPTHTEMLNKINQLSSELKEEIKKNDELKSLFLGHPV